MPKVHIAPTPAQHPLEGGILRVIQAMRKHLPMYGWEVVDEPDEADVLNTHSVMSYPEINDKPVVQSSHGLMWYDYWKDGRWDTINHDLVQALKRADAITAPSHWVARAIARCIAGEPVVIHHGVDADEWQPEASQGYALWNKARSDEVSDHRELEKLAALMPDVPFMSTIGQNSANLHISGVVPYAEMKRIVAHAGVYLALPRETFGIGTLEAMACGVPIAGWDYGGQHDIVVPGQTGYLAPYGDWPALADCVRRCLAERERLAANAVADVRARWGWDTRIQQYAELFARVSMPEAGPKVSVIVTSYNLARFLPAALDSLLPQTMPDWEVIIVNDCGNDDTPTVAVEWMARNPGRATYLRTPQNLGLPAARNFGIAHAAGKYVIPLDADDMLAPGALEVLSRALDADKSLHIAYGHLDVMSEDGAQRSRSGWPVHGFDYAAQLAHTNQLHYSAMMRRSIWERTQGYRRRSWQAEDAEFWGYATSFGLTAQRVTAESTLVYRMRSGSKSSTNAKMDTQWADGDWSAWYTWRDKPENTPFGAEGKPNASVGSFWRVPHHADPKVSIIIPVGPSHAELLQDALDSVLAQTFTEWEVVVVNDTGRPLDMRGYAFAEVVDTDGERGPAHARNLGVKHAAAQLVVFLDADDLLQPAFLETVINAYRAEAAPVLIYTDWFKEYGQGDTREIWLTNDWDWRALKGGMINNVTALLPKAAHDAIGGFDESLPGWEDWDYMLRLAVVGLCGKRIPQPLMTYRYQTGLKREASYAKVETLRPQILNHYLDYFEGRKVMACSSCGGGRAKALTPTLPQGSGNAGMQMRAANVPGAPQEGMTLLEYMGDSPNTLRYVGRPSETAYRFSATPDHKLKYVFTVDVAYLLTLCVPGRQGVPLFRRADEAQPAIPSQPLVVRDRPAPISQSPVAQTAIPRQQVQAMPAALPPMRLQPPPPALAVQPIPKPAWQLEAERQQAARTGIQPVQAQEAPKVPEAQPMLDVAPMAAGVTPAGETFAAPPHAVEVVPAEKPLLERPYAEIRNAVPTLTPEQARTLLAQEQAGKKRQGVINLLQTHLKAVAA